MTRLIKDSSLFAVFDPDSGRENLYQYSGAQLFADVSLAIESEVGDLLSVINADQDINHPGGRLDLVGTQFTYTPAYQHVFSTGDIVLVADYNAYDGTQVLEGETDKQYDWNQYFSTQVNINTTFRVAQEVSVNSNGITYDDATSPTYIVEAEADKFTTMNHDAPLLLENVTPNRARSESSTVDDLTRVREYHDAAIAEISSNVDNIADFIRQTENINEGGRYHLVKATGAENEPGRSDFDPDDDASTAPEVVFFFPGTDQKWSDTTKVRIHQNFIRDFDINGDPIEGTYNYKRFITGGYINFVSNTDEDIVYIITGHISDGGDPDGSEGQQIGETEEDYFEFEVDFISGPSGDMLEAVSLYRVNLYSLEAGINIEQADSRYVNVVGDEVTGTLDFITDAHPITVSDAAGNTHLTIASDGVISQLDAHENQLDSHMVSRKNLTDAITEASNGDNAKYVKRSGDSMSGGLTIGTSDDVALTVADSTGTPNLQIKPTGAAVSIRKNEEFEDSELVTKKYVDSVAIHGEYLPIGGGTMTGEIVGPASGNALRCSEIDTYITADGRIQVKATGLDSTYLFAVFAGGLATDMSRCAFRVTGDGKVKAGHNISDPFIAKDDNDVTTKKYVDERQSIISIVDATPSGVPKGSMWFNTKDNCLYILTN